VGSAPGTGFGSILLNFVGGLPPPPPGAVAATRGRDITVTGARRGC